MNYIDFYNIDDIDISKFIYENREDVPIIATIKITNSNWGRLDTIVNKYYQGQMEYYKLLLDWNHIINPLNVKIGQMIDVPDFNYLLGKIIEINLFEDDKIPGVSSSMNSLVVNRERKESLKSNTNSSETTAIPKLKVKVNKVKYDSQTGVITF